MINSPSLVKVMYPSLPVGMVVSFAVVIGIVDVVIGLLMSIKQIFAV